MAAELGDYVRGRVGTELNRKYRLERLIGAGGMAAVYQAVHRNGNRVAIKVLHPFLSVDGDLRSRFLREGYVANKVNHRGAVRVLDDDAAEDGSVFLVMELLVGETLDARATRMGGRLALREVWELGCQLLEVLAAAHDQGVVHRDIKPDNVFLTDENCLKVLDFGIARIREGQTTQMTMTGRTIGTPAFMPPEQALGRSRQIDGRTDLWAAAATLFTLASGHYVHEAETVEEMLIHSGSRPARSLGAVTSEVPAAVVAVIDRALAFDRELRWPDARAMAAALDRAFRGAASSPPIAPTVLDASLGAPTVLPRTEPMRSDAAAPAFAVSTTGGVAGPTQDEAALTPAGIPRRRQVVPVIAAVLLLGTLCGGGVALFFVRQGEAPAAADPAPSSSHASASLAPTPAAPPPAPIAVAPSGIAVPPVPPAVTLAATTTGSTSTGPAPAAAEPVAPRRVSASVPLRAAKPEEATPKPNCDVPFYVDRQGIQRIRPECK
jgi:eukaryotic-like serine/threonine-protein kinase